MKWKRAYTMNSMKLNTTIDRSLIQTEKEMLVRWGDYDKPFVSINCITYNHEKYIADALDGFLIQKIDFPIEILVHDDASTDRTPEIIRSYEERYPNIIKPIYQKMNQYSQGKKPSVFNFKRAQGEYVAMCEGDDYWTDPYKLQLQVDFLESHPDYSLCFCNVEVIYEDPKKQSHPGYIDTKMPNGYLNTILIPEKTTNIERLARGNYIHTPGVLFRNWLREQGIPEYMSSVTIGDWPLHLRTATFGKIRYFREAMVVYRVHETGMWSTQSHAHQQRMSLLQYPPLLVSPLFSDSIKSIWKDILPRRIAGLERSSSGDEEMRNVLNEVRIRLTDVWPTFPSALDCARKILKSRVRSVARALVASRKLFISLFAKRRGGS